MLIGNGLSQLKLTAQREKRLLRMPTIPEVEMEYDVSDVSAVPHLSQVTSQEATDTFFDMMSVSDVDTETLTDA